MPDVASATIRQIVALASVLEQDAGEKFIRLELGNPGIPAEDRGIERNARPFAQVARASIPMCGVCRL